MSNCSLMLILAEEKVGKRGEDIFLLLKKLKVKYLLFMVILLMKKVEYMEIVCVDMSL